MSNQLSKIFLIAILLFSALLITVFLQPGDIISNTPIYNDDYALHLSECLSAQRFLSTAGHCWGYDPFLLAGFPRGTLANADNKAWELFYYIFSPVLGEGLGFKAYLIIFLLIYPLLIYLAARNFSLSIEQSLLAAVIAILYFHLSLTKDFVSWGVVSYVFAVFFSMYIFSAYYRLLQHFTWVRYLGVTVFFSLLVLMHILSFVHIAVPILILYIAFFKKMTVRQNVAILFIPFTAAVVNSYWIVPLLEFFNDKTIQPADYEFNLQIKSLLEPLRVYIDQKKSIDYNVPILNLNNTFIDVLLLVFSWSGFYTWYRKRSWHLIVAFTSAFVFMFGVAFYGSHTILFAQLQPERFNIPLSLLLLIPATIGIYNVAQALLRGHRIQTVVFISCVAFILLYRPVIRPFITIFKFKPYQVSCVFPDNLRKLINYLENHTNREGRVLIEDSEYLRESPAHEYYGGHFPGLFPEYLKREYLCGPRPMYPIKHGYASFNRGVLFNKNISDYSFSDLQKRFDTYNVKWIVCWFKESKVFLDRFPDYIIKLADIDKFTIYEVKRRASFFIKGNGTVLSDYNRLELNNIIAEDNEIIISYHWMKTLKPVSEGSIERVLIGDDPVGFIKIKHPPRSLAIVNSYQY
jgi:hypothetical protein